MIGTKVMGKVGPNLYSVVCEEDLICFINNSEKVFQVTIVQGYKVLD